MSTVGLFYRHVCDSCRKIEEVKAEHGRVSVDPPKGWVTVAKHDGTSGGVFATYVFCGYECMITLLIRQTKQS